MNFSEKFLGGVGGGGSVLLKAVEWIVVDVGVEGNGDSDRGVVGLEGGAGCTENGVEYLVEKVEGGGIDSAISGEAAKIGELIEYEVVGETADLLGDTDLYEDCDFEWEGGSLVVEVATIGVSSSKEDWLEGLWDNSFEEVPNIIGDRSLFCCSTSSLAFHLPAPKRTPPSPTSPPPAPEVPFIKLAKLTPAIPPAPEFLPLHLALEASISLSNLSVTSFSSSVGPVPILCNPGGLAPPPMKLANEAIEVPGVELDEEAASARILLREEAESLESAQGFGGKGVSEEKESDEVVIESDLDW